MITHSMQKSFPSETASVRLVRQWLRSCLADLPVPLNAAVPVDDAVAGLSEIAANAVIHGEGDRFMLVAQVESTGTVTVRALSGRRPDGAIPAVQSPDEAATSGRGLAIVAGISEGNWGWEPIGRDLHVWFCVAGSGLPSVPAELLADAAS